MGDRNQEIRERAYALWEQEGRPEGRAADHWSAAAAAMKAEGLFRGSDGAEAPPSPTGSDNATARGEALTSEDAGQDGPVSEIDTIHRTLETSNARRAGMSPQEDTEGAMSGEKGRRL